MVAKSQQSRTRRTPVAGKCNGKKKPTAHLHAVKSARLFEGAVDQLRLLIVNGDLRPGERLPSEFELTTSFRVSRASVREALRSLESKGLIEVRPGTGAFVAARPFSFGQNSDAIQWLLKRQDSLYQLLQVREALEALAASLAAAIVSDGLLFELRAIVRQQEALPNAIESLKQHVELDARFHMLIAKGSENAVVEEFLNLIVPAFDESNGAVLYLSPTLEKTLVEHQQIIEALAMRDSDQAESAIRAHITRVRNEINSLGPRDETAEATRELSAG